MRRSRLASLTPLSLVVACSTALAITDVQPSNPALDALVREFPGVRALVEQNRVRILYGAAMTSAQTPLAAAESFLARHTGALGVGPVTAVLDWSAELPGARGTVFTYRQLIDNIPVEYGMIKVLVRTTPAGTSAVAYAGSTLSPRPTGGFPAIEVDAAAADAITRVSVENEPFDTFTTPELVVFQGNGDWVAPVRCWKITGSSSNPAHALARTFFVDAATGQFAHIRSDIHRRDVSGAISANATPGVYPDEPTNPPVPLAMPNIKLSIPGGAAAFALASGGFTIPAAGPGPFTVTSGVASTSGFGGEWVNVVPAAGSALTTSTTGVTPATIAAIFLNAAPVETTTAQANAFRVVTLTHNYFKDRAPGFTRLDVPLRANTGVEGTCNAFYSGAAPSVNFFNAGDDCVNTAYSSVISHEYGHFIVGRLGPTGSGLPQNAFGEGFGDSCAALLWDDRVAGRNFITWGPVRDVRDPIAANIQYPCSSAQCLSTEIHCCGQMLSGIWWRIRTNLGDVYGTDAGLERARDLHVAWALLTTGGASFANPASPATAVEVLVADDSDANLSNGTPDFTSICAAFSAHGITCPLVNQPPCYANCDGSTVAPTLNAGDFTCFLSRFRTAASLSPTVQIAEYANCDASTIPPVLNAGDFACFLVRFRAGCP